MMKISLPLRVHCVAVGLAVSSVFGADPCHYPAEIQIMCQGKGCSGNITVHFCSEPGGSPKRCPPQGYQSCCAAQITGHNGRNPCKPLWWQGLGHNAAPECCRRWHVTKSETRIGNAREPD